MKAIGSKVTKALSVGSRIKCIDNSGAKEMEIIAVKGFKGRRRMHPKAGVSDLVICAVKKGSEKIRHEVVRVVIVRQKKEYRRPNGLRIKFEDNAGVIVNEKGEPRGTQIKGPIAKEVVERFPTVGKLASMVV